MNGQNWTLSTEIVLLGFQHLQNYRIPIFILFLLLYIFTVLANFLIIILVSSSHNLHSPMYCFLCHLSFSDILLTTNTVPNMLLVILKQGTMNLRACITQGYIFALSLSAECLLLTVMSYDRYLAICKPLHYSSIMDNTFHIKLVSGTWLLGSLSPIVTDVLAAKLHFCGVVKMDHFYCDFASLLELSCSDTHAVKFSNILSAAPLTIVPVIFITATYVHIFQTILKIPSKIKIQKAFSTCSSHLTVVCIFYGTVVTLYVFPATGYSLIANKILSLLYTVVTPLLNPIIYSMRNHEIRAALQKFINGRTVMKM
ncbi:olfactory receptor 11A1-like [Bombina bombina]|uniref:olfactory receptor 11A1-like n=1 Tax=Bombina bombina TaxID=8345 RepID=UPI00235AF85D|nr:olfactory receptor 11A1-like [Bombina bombina]